MNIKELQARRDKLEHDISATTQTLINEFEADTSVQITGVTIDIHQIGAMGEPIRSIVGETKVDLDI